MTERERRLEALLRELLAAIDHAARCGRCVVDLDCAARAAAFEKIKDKARAELAPERRPN